MNKYPSWDGERLPQASPHSPVVFDVGKCKDDQCGATVYAISGAWFGMCSNGHEHRWSETLKNWRLVKESE